MSRRQRLEVAVLLATYNGERYIEQQLRSLKSNDTRFTLHWLDDHSTDNTREIVRSVAHDVGIELREWHQSRHLGVPGVFFQILECVEADIYLFCDQDDIWQTGKIDATVTNLVPDLDSPVMAFTVPLVFKDDKPDRHFRMLDIMHVTLEVALQESRIFMPVVTWGHTQGFTRALRELYIRHKDIAREHAAMHDSWMYGIAVASGTARILADAPTVLYRWHGKNWCSAYFDWGSRDTLRLTMTRSQYQLVRRLVSRNAEGFVRASATLPQSVKLDGLLTIAKLLAVIHERQSPYALIRLLRRRALSPYRRLAFGTAAACLCSNAMP